MIDPAAPTASSPHGPRKPSKITRLSRLNLAPNFHHPSLVILIDQAITTTDSPREPANPAIKDQHALVAAKRERLSPPERVDLDPQPVAPRPAPVYQKRTAHTGSQTRRFKISRLSRLNFTPNFRHHSLLILIGDQGQANHP
ncbi:hypothetical protein [Nocardia camponoti]|uniref:hypothetical protein n=1 Tax=Nocardia camponoti TaxID=1616106 RepID=UPI00166E8A16|nr:hypothetical protein [Nocardia camponoti]